MAYAPPRAVHWWPTLGIMLGGLAVAMSQGSLNVAIPSMMSSLGTDLDRIQWVQTGYGIAQAVLIPAVGWRAPRQSRGRTSCPARRRELAQGRQRQAPVPTGPHTGAHTSYGRSSRHRLRATG